jgi:hypothetical protein
MPGHPPPLISGVQNSDAFFSTEAVLDKRAQNSMENDIEIVSLTDVYPMKTKINNEVVNTKYRELFNLRIAYFEKLSKIFKKLS